MDEAVVVQRATFALKQLIQAHAIQDSGKGRERRYFKR
jgi:hypothetical protein